MDQRRYLNADHDPTDFASCSCGEPTRPFELPAGKVTGREGDWILAYVCDVCAEAGAFDGGEADDPPIIQVPHLERLTELRMNARGPSALAH